MVKTPYLFDRDTGGVWHPGELELQRRVGAVEQMAKIGTQHVRNFMPDQHRRFFEQLPFIIVGTTDDAGNPWAGIRTGEPGFARSPDPRSLLISGLPTLDDPVETGLKPSAAVGLLGIELHTRRRNRMNGVVNQHGDDLVQIDVVQSFGNCPQYIQLRHLEKVNRAPDPVEQLSELDTEARTQIDNADTFFVATYADRPGGRQIDVSHRGGRPGFLGIDTGGALTIPDFAGNRFFATLGNILINGRAGLMFIDFQTGTLLQLTGRAKLLATGAHVEAFRGAERFWRFWPEQVIRRRHAIPFRFTFDEWSSNLQATGTWAQSVSHDRLTDPGNTW